jgi:hypothetical protein
VLALLRAGKVVRSLHVTEPLNLRRLVEADDYVRKPIHFFDCQLPYVDLSFVYVEAPVVFSACAIDELLAMACYFFGGLTIERCEIAGPTNLSCGGHNRNGHAVVLSDTRFGGFVDFCDNQYEGPVRIERCQFTSGTNLFHPYSSCSVYFKVPPIVEANEGELAASEPTG